MRRAPSGRSLPLVLIGLSVAIFGALGAWVLLAPATVVDTVERALQAPLIGVGSPTVDRIMVRLTMLGDFPLTAMMMSVVVVLLLLARRVWLAVHAMAVFLGIKLIVGVVKTLVDRARPLELYPGGDIFSFPSGHTASAAVLLGVCSCLFAGHGTSSGRVASRWRSTFVTPLLAALVLLVALSRVYLQAHWPSDVIASVVLASALVATFQWQLEKSARPPVWLPFAVATCLAAASVGYLLWQFEAEFERYRLAGAFGDSLAD